MGKIPQGILGGVSGKIGGVVGSSWKGINVLKTLPLSVANPKTASQVAQRTKFSNTVALAGTILATIIKPLWDRFASKMSGYNEFVSKNIDLFASEIPSTPVDLVISQGKMAKTVIADAVATDATEQVVVTWVDDSGTGFKLASDEAYVVIISEDEKVVEGFETAVIRSAETLTVTFANGITSGEIFYVYLAFKRADGTIVSNTAYFNEEAP